MLYAESDAAAAPGAEDELTADDEDCRLDLLLPASSFLLEEEAVRVEVASVAVAGVSIGLSKPAAKTAPKAAAKPAAKKPAAKPVAKKVAPKAAAKPVAKKPVAKK